ncbi:hypothetical protein CC86DRAFT_399445 [Ophiobolus disseminans]|uniref:Cyanovirin-N domain-containing protein n=1 Tax=Ophiobolus disseminans TaxID=1469910 RepID=A0A6A7AHK8_9PLEO|nr:hypothetical protein CC86DRAFT_399445 [Ophiobolus disseminans]
MKLLLFFLAILLTLVNCASADENCGLVYQFGNDHIYYMPNDKRCHKADGIIRYSVVYKGCACIFFHEEDCGHGNRHNGVVIVEGSKDEKRLIKFKEHDRARWYYCQGMGE